MGRRFWLILVFLLLASAAPPPVRAQDAPDGPTGPDTSSAAPSELPLPRPLDLPQVGEMTRPAEAPKDAPRMVRPSREATTQDASPQRKPASGGLPVVPPLSPAGSMEQVPEAAGTSKAARASRPTGDPDVLRTDGPSPPAGESTMGGLPVEQLPAGKQAVAVTVDVKSPPDMNLHQEAIVSIVVRNTGASDALQVRIRDELPEGLKFIKSVPDPTSVDRESVLTWSLPVLAAGKDQVIKLHVEPVRTGDLDHGVSVWFQTGTKARTKVHQPKLKIELAAGAAQVLRGQPVEFKVRVTNIGDGPARNVTVTAKLSEGLRYGSSGRGIDEMITEPIPVLAPEQSEDLDPLVAEAILAGDASCTVKAASPDVIARDKAEEAVSVQTIKVVEPRLKVEVRGPTKRCTETNATYSITVANPGTAPARKVRVVGFVPPGVRLVAVPEGARYDHASRRLQWSIDPLEPGPDHKLSFEVKVGSVGHYEVAAEAYGSGGLKEKSKLTTEVFGMPDVDLAVSERQRVVDVGDSTIFIIRVRNYGTVEARNIVLSANLSKNLEVLKSADVPAGVEARQRGQEVRFFRDRDDKAETEAPVIQSLGPGKELYIGLEVKVTGAEPKLARCRVLVKHDGLSEPLDDEAHVQVLGQATGTADSGGR
jgi:uncharacterized repeat protein (TIGR01451 family)